MPYTHSTFVTSIQVDEIKDNMYIFSFINSYSEQRFVLQIAKDLFDIAFEHREIGEPVTPFKIEDEIQEEEEKINEHMVS